MLNARPAKIKLSFWGVRGSIPSSPDPSEYDAKLFNILKTCQLRNLKVLKILSPICLWR